MDKGVRGRWRNTSLHMSLILVGDFWIHTLKVNILHASMVLRREVFDDIMGNIFRFLLPLEADFLFDVTLHPVEAHVKGFGAFPEYVASEDAVGGCVVSLDWIGQLRKGPFQSGSCGWEQVDGR